VVLLETALFGFEVAILGVVFVGKPG